MKPDLARIERIVSEKTARAASLRDIARDPAFSVAERFQETIEAKLSDGKEVDWHQQLALQHALVDLARVGIFARSWSTLEALVMELACAAGIQKGKEWVCSSGLLAAGPSDPLAFITPLNNPSEMLACLSARPAWKTALSPINRDIFKSPVFELGAALRNCIAHRDGHPSAAYIKLLKSDAGKIFGFNSGLGPEGTQVWDLLTRPVTLSALAPAHQELLRTRRCPTFVTAATAFAELLPWAIGQIGGAIVKAETPG